MTVGAAGKRLGWQEVAWPANKTSLHQHQTGPTQNFTIPAKGNTFSNHEFCGNVEGCQKPSELMYSAIKNFKEKLGS
jgi:hypothetical protein